MSGLITGRHLQSYDIDDKTQKELERFGEWVATAVAPTNFQSISDAMKSCKHKDRHRQLEPVLKAMNYKACNFHLGGKQMLISSRKISNIKSFVQIRVLGLNQPYLHISSLFE
jgi:hypothetical protein